MDAIRCSIIRGGTSKGVFLLEQDLPPAGPERDRLLLALMGSPDPRQIDGLGGADPLTSKVVVVAPSSRPGVDVEYESIEVGVGESVVNHGIMCGNLLAGTGYFALNTGLLAPQHPICTARIWCRSNQKLIIARWPAQTEAASGRYGTAARLPPVTLSFEQPDGAVTGALLPTGKSRAVLQTPGGERLEFSVVDAGTLYAFMRAGDYGLSGNENPAALDADGTFRARIEAARVAITAYINDCRPPRPLPNPRRLKLALVAAPTPGVDADILAKVINPTRVHKAYAVSGAICLAAAAVIPGTLVHEIVHPAASPCTVRIQHPGGILRLSARYASSGDTVDFQSAEIERSSRVLLQGTAFPGADP